MNLGLSYNPGRSHSLFVETIGDGIIFVYKNKLQLNLD